MGRKQRIQDRKSRLEEKAKTFKGLKKQRYKQMAASGKLGKKELDKYKSLYDQMTDVARQKGIPSIDDRETPTRGDYNSLRMLYAKQEETYF